MAGTFGKHGVETQLESFPTDLVRVDKLGVAEGHRGLAEIFFDGTLVLEHLVAEFRNGAY